MKAWHGVKIRAGYKMLLGDGSWFAVPLCPERGDRSTPATSPAHFKGRKAAEAEIERLGPDAWREAMAQECDCIGARS